MTSTTFHMVNAIDAVDPMVLTLKTAVQARLGPERTMHFEICVIEALTNIVEHAKTADKDVPIQLSLSQAAGQTRIDIFDAKGAAPFDLRVHAPDLQDLNPMSERGRGLALIMQCADHVEYGAIEGRNRLCLGFDNLV